MCKLKENFIYLFYHHFYYKYFITVYNIPQVSLIYKIVHTKVNINIYY